jgi:hypothetical protein
MPRRSAKHRGNIERCIKWCFIAQPRCNSPPCSIYRCCTQDSFTVEPDLTHICPSGHTHTCTGTRPHPRRAIPTSAPRTTCGRDHCCEKDVGCARRQEGAYIGHGRHCGGVPAADVLVEHRRVKRLRADPTPSTAQCTKPSAPAMPEAPISSCSIQRCSGWCFIAQPRCNELPFTDRIHKTRSQLSQASPTSAPLDTPTSAPGLAHIQGGPSPHLRREHLQPGPLLREGRRLRATAGGRMPGTCSKHSRCSSCRCSG